MPVFDILKSGLFHEKVGIETVRGADLVEYLSVLRSFAHFLPTFQIWICPNKTAILRGLQAFCPLSRLFFCLDITKKIIL